MGAELERVKQTACAHVDRERAALLDLSLRIHSHPKLRFEEQLAAQWLSDYLAGVGFVVERGAYGVPTAFAARLGAGVPRVAILCEYDALPGLGHACGHNIIAAAGAGAGAALAPLLAATGGSLTILGTPAEEAGGGKIVMAHHGAFEGLDAALMVHPAGADLPAMHVLAVSFMEVVYRGRAAHAAAFPHQGINALDALVSAYNALAQLRQHIRPTERLHGIITDGGQAANIVPERAAGLFCVRAATAQELAALKERVIGCLRAGALATGAEVELRPQGADYAEMRPNPPLIEAYMRNMERLGRPARDPCDAPAAVAGSTDMGNVSQLVPAIHPMIAAAPPHVPLHSTEFAHYSASESGQRAVIDGAKALAMTALDVLCRPDLRADMHAAFRGTRSTGA